MSKVVGARERALEPATTEEAAKEHAEDRKAQELQVRASMEQYCKQQKCKDIPIHKWVAWLAPQYLSGFNSQSQL